MWSLCSVSSTLSHANLEQPFSKLTNKNERWNIVKEVFLRLSVCVVYSCDFIIVRLSNYCVVRMLHEHVYVYISIYMYISAWISRWVYNIVRFGACAIRVLQGFKTNLVTVNDSFKHHNPTSKKRGRERCWNWKK